MPRFALDLNQADGKAAVNGQWKFAEGYLPGAPNDGLVLRSEGSPARFPDYDDSSWAVSEDVAAWASIDSTYITGVSFVWYRMKFTLPETVAGRAVGRTRVMFETCVDDYGEIWIDGQCNRDRGAIAGFNQPQRVEVSASPNGGDEHTIAILAINGPFADPGGGVFVRHTTLTFEWRDDDP